MWIDDFPKKTPSFESESLCALCAAYAALLSVPCEDEFCRLTISREAE
jgi:hypothetical protein